MINFLSSWAEQIIIAVIVASIIEMILPDNKNKKYIKMVIGIYILFSIISPFVSNKDIFSLDDFSLESYATTNTITDNNTKVNQSSMDDRLQNLYIEELEKNITQTVEEQGYKVNSCKVDAILYGEEEKQGINKIKLVVSKNTEQTDKEDSNIKSVDKVEINVGLNKYIEKTEEEIDSTNKKDIQSLKEVISKTYEIDVGKVEVSIE